MLKAIKSTLLLPALAITAHGQAPRGCLVEAPQTVAAGEEFHATARVVNNQLRQWLPAHSLIRPFTIGPWKVDLSPNVSVDLISRVAGDFIVKHTQPVSFFTPPGAFASYILTIVAPHPLGPHLLRLAFASGGDSGQIFCEGQVTVVPLAGTPKAQGQLSTMSVPTPVNELNGPSTYTIYDAGEPLEYYQYGRQNGEDFIQYEIPTAEPEPDRTMFRWFRGLATLPGNWPEENTSYAEPRPSTGVYRLPFSRRTSPRVGMYADSDFKVLDMTTINAPFKVVRGCAPTGVCKDADPSNSY